MDSNEIQENCDNSPRHCDIGAEETYQKTFVFLNVIENSVAVSTYNDVVQSFRRLRSQKSKKKYNWPLIIAIVVFLIGLATIIVYALRYGAFSNQVHTYLFLIIMHNTVIIVCLADCCSWSRIRYITCESTKDHYDRKHYV